MKVSDPRSARRYCCPKTLTWIGLSSALQIILEQQRLAALDDEVAATRATVERRRREMGGVGAAAGEAAAADREAQRLDDRLEQAYHKLNGVRSDIMAIKEQVGLGVRRGAGRWVDGEWEDR
jgi:hypothetical protein